MVGKVKVTVDQTPHEHKYVYLRQDVDKDGGFHPESKYYDVFFCEACLTYKRVLVGESVTYGDGRTDIIKRYGSQE
jgi:hypothetical protein